MEPTDLVYCINKHYIHDLAQDVSDALFQKISGFHRSRNLAALASCSCHFDSTLHSVGDWRFLRQVEAFFKKNALFAQKDVCAEAARSAFKEAEEQCSNTNIRLRKFVGYPGLLDQDLEKKILKMTRYISNVLGEFQPFLDSLPNLVKVTSGATSTSSRRNSLPQNKMRMTLFSTKRAAKYLKAIYHLYGFNGPRTKTTMSNRVELVPKNWKTDRTIACEPEGNLPLQLAFDTYAKRRLRRFGINLSDQSANQRLAKHASIHDDFVTVDFSKASDTISYNTVSLVFPVEWFSYLDQVRTPFYRGAFGEGTYSKFSSMGNGSTFTIETLIFAAACYAVGSKKFLVYGDDVVIEKELYEDYIALTRFLGFTINLDKSFADGPFRESCGKDYFDGVDVTPVYIRNIDKRKACFCHLINTLASIAPIGGRLEKFLFSLVREQKLPLVPYNESTLSGIWIEPREARRHGILTSRHYIDSFKAYIPVSHKRYFVDSRGYYLWFLRKNSQVLFKGPWEISNATQLRTMDEACETSSVAVFDHKYVRKRVGWIKPTGGTPVHLYWWTELLTSRS